MKLYFTFKEFCIDPSTPLPISVAQKLLDYHIIPMSKVREIFGKPIIVSDNSGYRSKLYEVNKGRSGKSQHTFYMNGAADYTCSGDITELLDLIIKHTNYHRICYYKKKNFLHCDYGVIDNDKRQYFEDDGDGWEFIKHI
jgi:uncharacterized protein YcbK (DUF882 family)